MRASALCITGAFYKELQLHIQRDAKTIPQAINIAFRPPATPRPETLHAQFSTLM